MSNARLQWIDRVKGIGILFVILGHIPGMSMKSLVYIYSFHVPLFFFLSGYLFSINKHNDFRQFIKKRFHQLLKPYFIFTLFSILIYLFLNKLGSSQITSVSDIIKWFFFVEGKMLFNIPLWYLFVSFLVEIFYYCLCKFIKERKMLLTLIIGCSVLSYGLTSVKIILPFGINMVLMSTLFYGFGNLVKDVHIVKKNKAIKNLIYLFAVTIQLAIIAFGKHLPDLYNLDFGNYFVYIISSFAGIIVYVKLAHVLCKYKIIQYLGRNTLIILSTHAILIYFITIVAVKIMNVRIFNIVTVITMVLLVIFLELFITLILESFLNFIFKSNNQQKYTHDVLQ